MSGGVGITGLIANLPGTITPYPTQDPSLELGGYRSVANIAARDAIPANFRVIGMQVTLIDTGDTYQLVGGITNADWVLKATSAITSIIRNDLADLVARDSSSFPNGCKAYVISERCDYILDTQDPLTTFSPLIIQRGSGSGKWYKISRKYVVTNYTLWCDAFAFGAVGFTPGQLVSGTGIVPDIVLNLGPLSGTGQEDIIIDALGNIWQTFNTTTTAITIRKFLANDCLRSGTPTKALEIALPVPASSESACIVFDSANRLWTNNTTHGATGTFSLLGYGIRSYQHADAVALKTMTGTSTPSTGTCNQTIFDGFGNLWVALGIANNGAFNGGIVMYTKAQIEAGGTNIAATVYWTGSNFTGVGAGAICGLAFDSAGKIWTSMSTAGNQIKAWNTIGAVSGNPAPDIVLTSSAFNKPYTVAFDSAGNLWAQNALDNRLLRIPKASLSVSGAIVPDVIMTPTVALGNIAFPNNPDRCGLLPSGFPGFL